ncbi:uncharacterized protein MELLADRAFT_116600 [Melampsora larici-populina 98AG31]|uniref:Uncharacterized protein n=1 Tax=Melampsora larici-populina (strain 98AG31 / pathotype 3-4-7) TaxID=747676 RepID=F4RN23_MELLP|nr:uncharacterized protein MELLADRAFT_116600 [Melampsora larici-populina 98AG31]EGG06292.1 hypothetical protein MELLADRAFT_116600 [Melampsora larici-populina 98AG31]
MRRSSLDSIISSIETSSPSSPDLKSQFSSNPTLETIKVPNQTTSTSTLHHSSNPSHKRYLKLWSTYHSKEQEEEEVGKKRNKLSKSKGRFNLPLFRKPWKRSRFIKTSFQKLSTTHQFFLPHDPSTPLHPNQAPTPTSTKLNLSNMYPIIPESVRPTSRTSSSPRISYDSTYTTIDYPDSIRNSTGSELSFRCRGLVYSDSSDEEEIWNGCAHQNQTLGIKSVQDSCVCQCSLRVDDWVRIEDEDLLDACALNAHQT